MSEEWDSDESMYDAAMRVSDELAAWRRHGVLVTEDCGTCMATGGVRVPCMDCKNGKPPHSHKCPPCDGTGKTLKDGAHRFDSLVRLSDAISFPASWLEGASDE